MPMLWKNEILPIVQYSLPLGWGGINVAPGSLARPQLEVSWLVLNRGGLDLMLRCSGQVEPF